MEIAISTTASKSTCAHCSQPIPLRFLNGQSSSIKFCCNGCKTVYRLLNEKGLGRYYDLKKAGSEVRSSRPVFIENHAYEALLDEKTFALYAQPQKDGTAKIDFHLSGVHCTACVWLIEKIPSIDLRALDAKLDLLNSIASIQARTNSDFVAIAKLIESFGYTPSPIRTDEGIGAIVAKENRAMLIRIGVAAAIAMNIMFLSIPVYGGATGHEARLFTLVSLLLFIPSITYCALPFYKNVSASFKTRSLSVDVPLVIGLVLGAMVSIYNILIGRNEVYFDSISSLIFLLLLSRYVLKRSQLSAFRSLGSLQFLIPKTIKKWDRKKNDFSTVPVDSVQIDDVVLVTPMESIPVDGQIVKGTTHTNNSLLTGESALCKAEPGSNVFAGTVNVDGRIEVKVTRKGSETRIGEILSNLNKAVKSKSNITIAADRISMQFIYFIIAFAAITFAYAGTRYGIHEAFQRMLAIVIIACPCGIALATPFTMIQTLGRAARSGIMIKSAETVEKLENISHVLFDKTGTLTYGQPRVIEIAPAIKSFHADENFFAALYALEKESNHPVALAIVEHASERFYNDILVEDVTETIGHGVSGKLGTHKIELRKINQNDSVHLSSSDDGLIKTQVGYYVDNLLNAVLVLGDQVRNDARSLVDQLKESGKEVYILSGDRRENVISLARQVGISEDNSLSEATPEFKSHFVKNLKGSMMVGDGANDALAIAAADIGVAVRGGLEVSIQTSDIYFVRPGVAQVIDLFTISKDNRRILNRNFVFSFFYNVVGAGAASMGYVDPLIAAVVMPMSALTVFISSMIGRTR